MASCFGVGFGVEGWGPSNQRPEAAPPLTSTRMSLRLNNNEPQPQTCARLWLCFRALSRAELSLQTLPESNLVSLCGVSDMRSSCCDAVYTYMPIHISESCVGIWIWGDIRVVRTPRAVLVRNEGFKTYSLTYKHPLPAFVPRNLIIPPSSSLPVPPLSSAPN